MTKNQSTNAALELVASSLELAERLDSAKATICKCCKETAKVTADKHTGLMLCAPCKVMVLR